MRKIRVRIVAEAVEATADEAREYPTIFTWDKEFRSTGDNSAFYAGQLQNAVRRAAEEAIDNLKPYVVYGGIE